MGRAYQGRGSHLLSVSLLLCKLLMLHLLLLLLLLLLGDGCKLLGVSLLLRILVVLGKLAVVLLVLLLGCAVRGRVANDRVSHESSCTSSASCLLLPPFQWTLRWPLTIPEPNDSLEDLHLLARELLILCEVHKLSEDLVLFRVGAVVPVRREDRGREMEA